MIITSIAFDLLLIITILLILALVVCGALTAAGHFAAEGFYKHPSRRIIIGALLITTGLVLAIAQASTYRTETYRAEKYDVARMAEDMNLEAIPYANGDAGYYIIHEEMLGIESWTYYVPEEPSMSQYLLEE